MLKNKKFNINHLLKGLSFFVIIPLIFYIGIYLLFPNNNLNYTDNIKSIIKQQESMYNYHSKLEADHFFSSEWYTWPVSYKPVWYHERIIDDSKKETISGLGNLVIWFVGIFGMIYLIPKLILKKDKNSFYILILILSLWLPYIFIGRIMFMYHYFPVTPFMMLSLVMLLKDVSEKFKVKYLIPIYMILVVAFFITYYPVITGNIVEINDLEKLKIFNSWYF